MHTLKYRNFVMTSNDVVNFMGKLCRRCRAGRSVPLCRQNSNDGLN